tara:strand:- start:504 stop:893 length:390 start_codon:yes stop_codon:yes gene_type:complete
MTQIKNKKERNMKNLFTEDLSKFGFIELSKASDLLSSIKDGFPLDFRKDGVRIGFAQNTGAVFLKNIYYQICMLDDDGNLSSFYTTPSEGLEGFFEDLMEKYDDMDIEDQEYMQDIEEELKEYKTWKMK